MNGANNAIIDSVTEVLRQFTFIASVLAGFAVTFLVSLMISPVRTRPLNVTAIAALLAAISLLISTVSGFAGLIYVVDRPALRRGDFLPIEAKNIIVAAAHWSGSWFMAGIVALLLSIGASGWMHSRRLGTLTTTIASLTLILLVFLLKFVVPLI